MIVNRIGGGGRYYGIDVKIRDKKVMSHIIKRCNVNHYCIIKRCNVHLEYIILFHYLDIAVHQCECSYTHKHNTGLHLPHVCTTS
jgi:hypothetical protein